jgi:hypothetical protein
MTIRRVDETVLLEGVCAVEEAETLMQEIQAGATLIDWTECVHLHTACLQVILASGVPTRGTPLNPSLARWLPRMVPPGTPPELCDAGVDNAAAFLTEV